MVEKQETRGLVRLIDADLPGQKPIGAAMRLVKGVSFSMANAVCIILNLDPKIKSGDLNEKQLKDIENVLRNPDNHKIPQWMLNRRRDYDTGKDLHLLSNDVRFSKENDVKRMRMMKSYKGFRHGKGQPVRGQRTKAHFRKGSSVGVAKKPMKSGKV